MLRLNPLAGLIPVSPPSVGEQTLKYSLQLSFGNDDLEPLHSVIITVLPAVGPVVYRLAQLLTQDAPVTARLQDILESSPVSVMSVTDIPAFDMIGDALCVMAYHGLFSFTPKPA